MPVAPITNNCNEKKVSNISINLIGNENIYTRISILHKTITVYHIKILKILLHIKILKQLIGVRGFGF